MVSETEGLVLRRTRTVNGRSMIVLLTRKFGKISAGTSLSEGGRSRSALALRPFSYGRYELFHVRDSYSINSAQTLRSYYSLGEDLDKYAAASYALELTDRIAQEGQPLPELTDLISDLLAMLDRRKGAYDTLTAGFQIKLLQLAGCAPRLDACACCESGAGSGPLLFSVTDGGTVCEACGTDRKGLQEITPQMLSAMRYMQERPLCALEGIGLNEQTAGGIKKLLREYLSYHLGIDNLKSESLII